jgi:hypothetical protein
MNTPGTEPVPSDTSRQNRILPVLLALWTFGYVLQSVQCVGIDGGASELTWSLRTFEGESSSCNKAKISKIRLCWNEATNSATGCRPGKFREFSCKEETGVTLFEIEPGSTRFHVEPLCQDGLVAEEGTYQVPPEIVRTVRDGEVVTLDALLIVVTDPDTCSGAGCTCVRR